MAGWLLTGAVLCFSVAVVGSDVFAAALGLIAAVGGIRLWGVPDNNPAEEYLESIVSKRYNSTD